MPSPSLWTLVHLTLHFDVSSIFLFQRRISAWRVLKFSYSNKRTLLPKRFALSITRNVLQSRKLVWSAGAFPTSSMSWSWCFSLSSQLIETASDTMLRTALISTSGYPTILPHSFLFKNPLSRNWFLTETDDVDEEAGALLLRELSDPYTTREHSNFHSMISANLPLMNITLSFLHFTLNSKPFQSLREQISSWRFLATFFATNAGSKKQNIRTLRANAFW